jgi:transcriptional regulator with XRE-family HTH domain
MLDNENIINAIKTARKNRRLSQSELGHRIGVPQSHISKIEKGGVDIKLSSLVQIARVLDLELTLVPKRALPAVESIVTSFERNGQDDADLLNRSAYALENDDD